MKKYFHNMTLNKIVKSLFLILMAAYCLEVFIVLLDIYNEKKRKNYNIEYLSKYNIPFEKRDKFEVYLDLRKEKQNVALAVDPYHFLDDNIKLMPLSSFSNTTTILCNEYGLLSKYKSEVLIMIEFFNLLLIIFFSPYDFVIP